METHCITCGMPLTKKEDIGVETVQGPVCNYCIKADKSIKSCKEIFEGGVYFFMNSVPDVDKTLAERITRKNMNNLIYWKDKDEECLKGNQATEEEFQAALAKLHSETKKRNVNV